MDNSQDNLDISSRNPGYVATLSCVFEVKGIVHHLEVDRGLMRLVVPPYLAEKARQAISEFELQEKLKLPSSRFSHLTGLETDELEALMEQPHIWKQDEIEAAKQIHAVKVSTRQKAVDLIARVPMNFIL